MGFLEALIQSFKILLVGGVLAVFAGIIFIKLVQGNDTSFQSFSGRIFGALLVGVIWLLVYLYCLPPKATGLIKNFNRYFELTFWIVALICLAFTNPASAKAILVCAH
jgi:hypothetical protein